MIGGSGAYQFAEDEFGRLLDRRRVRTPFGESAPFCLYENGGFRFYFASRHGERGYEMSAPFVNYRANLYAAKLLGVERVVAWSGPGIVNDGLAPGSFLVPTDLIDFTKGRKATFFAGTGLGFIRQNPVFCASMGRALAEAAERSGRDVVHGGTYVCTEGPRLETPAEIRMFRMWGADVVGMTLVPEAFLARELEICYQPICYLTNYAEGVRELPYREGVLFEGTLPDEMAPGVEKAKELLPGICIFAMRLFKGRKRDCPCSVSMERYRRAGVIGEDFKGWTKGGDGAAE